MTPAECTISPVSVLTLLKCVSLQKREGERERERERGRERVSWRNARGKGFIIVIMQVSVSPVRLFYFNISYSSEKLKPSSISQHSIGTCKDDFF